MLQGLPGLPLLLLLLLAVLLLVKASEWPPVLLHGSSHSSTPL